jgi:putative FmdB family regulatory protein
MPIYEYQCEDCQTRYEKLVMAKGQEISCPKCASRRQTIQLSVFSAGNKSSSQGNGGGFSGGGCGCNPSGCGCH